MDTRTIEIDFEVHKAIELARKSFAETDNAVLRGLLGIDAQQAGPVTTVPVGRPWVGKGKSTGLTLPHGTELELDYNGQRFVGRVDNGALILDGRRFSSPSGAADELCRTKDGRRTSLNGKELIRVRLPNESEFALLKEYERRLRESNA